MKKCFLTGFALLLPLVLTILIILFIINLLTQPFLGTIITALDYYGLLNKPFWIFSGKQVLTLSGKMLVLVGIGVIACLVGFLGQLLIMRSLGKVGDYILHHIPLVKTLYKIIQDLVDTLFAKSESGRVTFSSVVLVPFPHSHTLSIGLVVSQHLPPKSDSEASEVSVFVPGTPNPTMGFMLLFRRDQLIPVDIGVDEALKLVVSCGVIWPLQHPQSTS